MEQNYKPIPFHQDTIFWSFIFLCSTPGFKKEDLKVQVDTLGRLTVSGERRLDEGKYTRFKKVFEVPTDSNLDKITGKFEHSILSVIMPLKEGAAGKKEEPQMEKATPTQEPKKENAATGKESAKIEKPAKKEEPKKEDVATGKESSRKEEKPAQKEEPKKEDAADGKESTKKEEIKSADKEKDKEKPKREDAETGKDRTKKEEKPMTQKQEPKKDNGATKKEEKLPMQKLKEEAKKEDGVKFGSGSCCTQEGTKKAEAEGDKLGQRKKQEGGCVDDTTKKEEKGWRRRNEQKETMVMETEEEEEETGLLERVTEQINKNKVAIAAAALAFSFGVYLSRKLCSN